MKFLHNRFVITTLRWLIAGVFIYAGVIKLRSPQNFSDSIATFSILPNSLINLMALILPPFEIIAGLAVIVGFQRRSAMLGLTVLISIFLLALASAIVRGISVDCGCFGSGTPSASATWIDLGRDAAMAVACLALYAREITKPA